jgi:hypothetical protein
MRLMQVGQRSSLGSGRLSLGHHDGFECIARGSINLKLFGFGLTCDRATTFRDDKTTQITACFGIGKQFSGKLALERFHHPMMPQARTKRINFT